MIRIDIDVGVFDNNVSFDEVSNSSVEITIAVPVILCFVFRLLQKRSVH